jgi:hypothetical protein
VVAQVAMSCRAGMALYSFVERFVSGVAGECERRQPAPHVANLVPEWRDVFAPALNADIYAIALSLLGQSFLGNAFPMSIAGSLRVNIQLFTRNKFLVKSVTI